MAEENYLSEQDIELISKMLDEAMTTEVYEQTQIDWDELKQSAINFLDAYEKLEILEKKQSKQQMTNLLSFDGFKNTLNIQKYSFQKTKINILKAKYLLAFNFDAKLTAFRGQLPKEAVYVFWDSRTKMTRSFRMSMNELVYLANDQGRLFLKMKDLNAEEISEIEKEEKNGLSDRHILEAQSAYRGVAARLTQFYNKTNVNWWRRKNGLLMWKIGKTWTIARVTSYGDVKEAYVAALMTKHQQNLDALYNIPLGTEAYYDHILIKTFFNNYINKVTNMAAIVEEDVNLEGNSAQYAVKSSGASLPSLNQYLKMASIIKSQSNAFEGKQEQVEELVRKNFPMDAKRNIELATVNSMSDEIVNVLLSDIQKTALASMYNVK